MSGSIRPQPFGAVDPRADQVFVRMRDGARLATDVYLPPHPTKVPTILVRLPYDKSGEFSFMSEIANRLTSQGFAAVVQDVRGKARSGGQTFAFVSEVQDGYDTLDWLVAQPWSNGAAGTFGDSYYGFTQWAAAISGHSALRAMVPRMTTTEIGRDWMYLDGVFNLGTMGEWVLHTWIDNSLNDVDIDWSMRPFSQYIEHHSGGLSSKSFTEWMTHGPDDAFWSTGIYGDCPMKWGTVPTLHVGGWFDVFSRGQLRDYQRSLSGSAGGDQYLIMGATDHFDDELTLTGQTPDYLSERHLIAQLLDRYLGPAEQFFMKYLCGKDVRIPGVRWQLGNDGWHESEVWPPSEAQTLILHLVDAASALRGPAGGGLAPSPERFRASVTWDHDPADPVPSLVKSPWRPLLRLPDERPVHARHDVLTFTSDECRDPLDLAGPVKLEVSVEAGAPSTHLIGRLCDVFPDGRTHLIVEGAVSVSAPVAGVACTVDLGDTGYRVRPGHRLRLQVSSSCFPRWIVHPGTGDNPFTAVHTRVVRHRIHVGGGTNARLILTVLQRSSE